MAAPDLQKLAEKIAKLLQAESQPHDLASLHSSIEDINRRLNTLENMRRFETKPIHPSLDKLNIAEAVADSIFKRETKETACEFEPNKQCDHCSMCNSRGF